ncbi:hypothetical protein BH10ACI3_BH10ACI3_20520 [soil metagenome]
MRDLVIRITKEVCQSYGFAPLDGGTYLKKLDPDNRSVEAAAILAMNDALEQLGVKNFAIYLSHSEVLANILETVRVAPDTQPLTFAAIRNFSKFNVEGFVIELQEAGVAEKASTILADLFLKTDEILNQEDDINQTVVSNLLNIINTETLSELGQILRLTGRKPVLIDPALPCELPYGPGIVIEARTSGLEFLGDGGCITRVDEPPVFAVSFDIENIIRLIENSSAVPSNGAVSRRSPVL